MAKATKPSELRAKTEDELNTLLLDLKKEQFNLRFQRAVGQTEGASRVREVRREIARLKTVQHSNKKSVAVAAAKS
ncbi:50S ribosomal protein L29 [Lichenicola cladoniae]|uniref:Large ribosomal subunit protein uL29 n=1 Tax=Lichenicola cladoniae TaxID=1484109 RepID=A0A6M8HMB4_9PROT|nr:50S ribosomal protein L29 [Lichenicola cladoniae]NPD66977.1 50S ribosomal protein L29 [Acetobacteraceae bacterium]QKE89529.1 50S ribosomal protein L29 [Lichenicola cladoniae]